MESEEKKYTGQEHQYLKDNTAVSLLGFLFPLTFPKLVARGISDTEMPVAHARETQGKPSVSRE